MDIFSTNEQLLNPMRDLIFKTPFGRIDFINTILGLIGNDIITTVTYQNLFNLQEINTHKLSSLHITVDSLKQM